MEQIGNAGDAEGSIRGFNSGTESFRLRAGPTFNSFVVANGGNFGIGITNPTSKLVVVGNTSIAGNTSIGTDLFVAGRIGIGQHADNLLTMQVNNGLGNQGIRILNGTQAVLILDQIDLQVHCLFA